MACHQIMGIVLDHRTKEAVRLQEVLTKHGCIIKGRFGVHEASGDKCAEDGLIVLTLCDDKNETETLLSELQEINGVKAKMMTID